jgi:tetratricopeptide (TPR) repeat protein
LLDYTQAVKLDPKYLAAYSNRGYAYYKAGDLERSLADFEKILELDPANADAKKSKNVITSLLNGEGEEKEKDEG